MANTDNTTSHLEIEDLYNSIPSIGGNHLDALYSLQKDIQENVYGYDFQQMRSKSMSGMVEFFQWNTHAQTDEAHEAMDALGGIKNGIGNAAWKPWKSQHKEIYSKSFNDLVQGSDLTELKMELIDELHFLFNKMHAVGLTTEELFNFYFAKNKENRDRQSRGY